jgi:spore coat protein CotH
MMLALAGLADAQATRPTTRPGSAQAASTKPAKPVPAVSSVKHAPRQPKPGEAVKITTAIGPGISGVVLEYQIVEPGAYVEFKDAEYAKNWVAVEMKRSDKKASKGRVVYEAELPGELQKHRRLVRYRIVAGDTEGKAVRWPLVMPKGATGGSGAPAPAAVAAGTPSNKAYFCYGGIPEWKGAIEPNGSNAQRATPLTFPAGVMNSIQAYHLIGKKKSVENVTWREPQQGKEYKYTGTLVMNGVVHDHVRFRARGGVWRYAMGKNMWKFDPEEGDKLKVYDDYGRKVKGTWAKLNLRSVIQLGSYGRRGEQGMYEAVGFRLFNLAGVPAPKTHWVQLRIIDEANESPADQYKGDFWGLYLAIENEDGRFLKNHKLPDGNLYKMANGFGELNNQGKDQPADSSDLRKFLEAYNSAPQTEEWWRQNLHLPSYYSYRSILECIHHYDIADGKNYDYYHNPKTGQWHVIPWDLDLTWGDHMYGDGNEPFKMRVARVAPFRQEYFDRLREIRDLLYNPEQTFALIDECAAVIADPKAVAAAGPTLAEADRRKWDYHPALAIGGQAVQGQFYRAAADQRFSGMVQQMKEYVTSRCAWIDANMREDEKEILPTPVAAYAGKAGHPPDGLKFKLGLYKVRESVAGVKWRIAEVTPDAVWKAAPRTPRAYEITAVWESAEMKELGEVVIPAKGIKAGKTYRVRVRVKNEAGRWSHWSEPVEFVAGK